jgi:PAS domain S-box-containing protein
MIDTSGFDSTLEQTLFIISIIFIVIFLMAILIAAISFKMISKQINDASSSSNPVPGRKVNHIPRMGIIDAESIGTEPENGQKLSKRMRQYQHDLKSYKKALKASENKYKSLINNLRSAILTINKSGKILTINRPGIFLLGCSSKEEAKKSNLFKDFGIPKEDCGSFIKLLREKGFVENFESILIKRTGEKAIIRISSQLIRGKKNQIKHINSIIRDITKMKLAEAEKSALEEELFHAEKLASIGQLAAGVAHEINNPLTNISLLTTSIRRRTEDPVIIEKLDKLTEQRKISAKIVSDLLQFSRKMEPKFTKLNLKDTVSTALAQIIHDASSKIQVKNHLKNEDMWVKGDTDLLRQVFINIFENAYDAMADGGTLVIDSKPVGYDFIDIEISDTGPGVPENIIAKIFDPFFSTKQVNRGTGLGLSICHGIIKTHGGKIYLQNHEDVGTSFFIQLPRWKDEV